MKVTKVVVEVCTPLEAVVRTVTAHDPVRLGVFDWPKPVAVKSKITAPNLAAWE